MPTELTDLTNAPMPGLMRLGSPIMDPSQHHPDTPHAPSAGELAFTMAENRELRGEVDRLRAERDRLLDTQRRIMELLGTTAPERLVHDLRNVLNERELFKALADVEGSM